jgi:tetratricopeptide (TPR) repeat protein
MFRSAALTTVLLLTVATCDLRPVAACDTCGGKSKPAVLIAGLGNHHHPVSTHNRLAQRFFDQGLTLLFGFNHEEAVRSFKRAAELDPKLAIAYWGIALALGPNYNMPSDPEMAKAAYEAAQKARSLASQASERSAPISMRSPGDTRPIPKPTHKSSRWLTRKPWEKWSGAIPTIWMPPRSMRRVR